MTRWQINFHVFFCLTSVWEEASRRLLPSFPPPVRPSIPTSCSTSPLFHLNSLSALGHSYDSSVCHIEDARQTDSQRVSLYLWRANHNLALEATSKNQAICAVYTPPFPFPGSWQFTRLYFIVDQIRDWLAGWRNSTALQRFNLFKIWSILWLEFWVTRLCFFPGLAKITFRQTADCVVIFYKCLKRLWKHIKVEVKWDWNEPLTLLLAVDGVTEICYMSKGLHFIHSIDSIDHGHSFCDVIHWFLKSYFEVLRWAFMQLPRLCCKKYAKDGRVYLWNHILIG